jgi:hypothetical protein
VELLTYIKAQWDRVGAWAAILIGALALLLGWLGISNTPYVAEQLPYIISGGLVGVFLLGVGGMLWLSADLRDEWRKLDDLETAVRDMDARTWAAPQDAGQDTAPESGPVALDPRRRRARA